MKKTGLNRYVYDFSVDYHAIAADDILIGFILFGFINKIFLAVKHVSSCNALKSVSMNNQECKIRA